MNQEAWQQHQENVRLRSKIERLQARVRDLEKSRDYWRSRWLTHGIRGRWRKK